MLCTCLDRLPRQRDISDCNRDGKKTMFFSKYLKNDKNNYDKKLSEIRRVEAYKKLTAK